MKVKEQNESIEEDLSPRYPIRTSRESVPYSPGDLTDIPAFPLREGRAEDVKEKKGEEKRSDSSTVVSITPQSVRGITGVDHRAAVAVYGVKGLPNFFPASTSSSAPSILVPSSSSAAQSSTFASSFPSTASQSVPPMSITIPAVKSTLVDTERSDVTGSSSIINYTKKTQDLTQKAASADISTSTANRAMISPTYPLNYTDNNNFVTTAMYSDPNGPSYGLTNAINENISDNTDTTSNNNSSNLNPTGGFQLSKYVRDIGIRARSLVGGLLKREEGAVQVCLLLLYIFCTQNISS